MKNITRKLALGSAQWGLDYGISNSHGKSTPDDVRAILMLAKQYSIDLIDTAQAYGDAELSIANSGAKSFKLVSKISIQGLDCCSDLESAVAQAALKSLNKLNLAKIYAILIHDVDKLLSSNDAKSYIKALLNLKKLRIVDKVGVSIYSASQVNKILELFVPDIVQAPVSIFDQRLVIDNTLSKLRSLGVEVHARSVFLQGLLLMSLDDLHPYFSPWKNAISDFHASCKHHQIHPRDLALGYACSLPEIDRCIVGVQNANQLRELVQSALVSIKGVDCTKFFVEDEKILNPSLWDLN